MASSKCISLLILLNTFPIFGQINGNFINEFQFGNIPNRAPADLLTNYSRLNLNYQIKNFELRSMSEVFVSQNPQTSYIYPSQISLRYSTEKIDIKVGNIYETIGRGNLLRSYEIPGSILEDKIFRSRSYFFKDLLGAAVNYNTKKLNLKLIAGKPLDNLLPPTEPYFSRRTETLIAFNPEYMHKKLKIGVGIMNYQNPTTKPTNFITSYASFGKGKNNFFVELSGNLDAARSYALYGGYNFSGENFGGSIEVKDYTNFLLGTGINQPPALVREHIYRVLNRSTHVLLPTNERGFQAEFFYNKNNHLITLNNTLAINNLQTSFIFWESFLEYQYNYENGQTFKAFFDYAEDEFKLEKNRISLGLQRDVTIFKKKLKLEFEAQKFTRQNTKILNQVYGLSVQPTKNLTISPVLEHTNDPFLTENKKLYFGIYNRLLLKSKYTIQAFVGERRGGPACNAGICYEVLDFKGVELKTQIRF